MHINIENIILELSKQTSTGIVDLSNDSHIYTLMEILNKQFDSNIVSEIIESLDKYYNLSEAPKAEPPVKKSIQNFPAVSKESGKKVYFQSRESRDAAINNGTHRSIKPTKKTQPQIATSKQQPKSNSTKKDGSISSLAASIKSTASKEAKPPEKKKKKKPIVKKVQKVKPVLIKVIPVHIKTVPKKVKKLGELNVKFFKNKPSISDVEFDKNIKSSRKFKRHNTNKKFQLNVSKTFPLKYKTFIERTMSLEKYDENNPPLSFVYGSGGAGSISSQAAEVLMLAFAHTKESSERLKIKDDMIQYITSLPKGSKLILDKSWIEAAYLQSESLHARLKYLHPEGYYIEQVAWDDANDVAALGLFDYKNNKGFSTDVYFRIKLPSGKTYLLEDSLKKDEKVFLLNTSTNEISSFAINKLDSNIQDKYKELVYTYTHGQLSKSQKSKVYKQIISIENLGLEKIDSKINPNKFRINQYDSSVELGKLYEKHLVASGKNTRLIPKLNDKALLKAFGSNSSEKEFAKSAIRSLKYGKIGSKEYADALKKITGKTGERYLIKASIFIGEYFSATGDGNIEIALQSHYKIAKTFQKDFLIGVATDENLRNGLMNKINESFPLKSLFDGEEQADIDSIPVFRQSLTNLFKTESYEDLKTHLIIRTNENGEYELVYSTANDIEAIPIARINVRQRGVGYDQNLALEMYLHKIFAQRIAKSNAELGIMTPGIKKQMDG